MKYDQTVSYGRYRFKTEDFESGEVLATKNR